MPPSRFVFFLFCSIYIHNTIHICLLQHSFAFFGFNRTRKKQKQKKTKKIRKKQQQHQKIKREKLQFFFSSLFSCFGRSFSRTTAIYSIEKYRIVRAMRILSESRRSEKKNTTHKFAVLGTFPTESFSVFYNLFFVFLFFARLSLVHLHTNSCTLTNCSKCSFFSRLFVSISVLACVRVPVCPRVCVCVGFSLCVLGALFSHSHTFNLIFI